MAGDGPDFGNIFNTKFFKVLFQLATIIRKDMVVAPIYYQMTLKRPAICSAVLRTPGWFSPSNKDASAARLEITDIRCDLPVP